jgi:hypothetical protein
MKMRKKKVWKLVEKAYAAFDCEEPSVQQEHKKLINKLRGALSNREINRAIRGLQ